MKFSLSSPRRRHSRTSSARGWKVLSVSTQDVSLVRNIRDMFPETKVRKVEKRRRNHRRCLGEKASGIEIRGWYDGGLRHLLYTGAMCLNWLLNINSCRVYTASRGFSKVISSTFNGSSLRRYFYILSLLSLSFRFFSFIFGLCYFLYVYTTLTTVLRDSGRVKIPAWRLTPGQFVCHRAEESFAENPIFSLLARIKIHLRARSSARLRIMQYAAENFRSRVPSAIHCGTDIARDRITTV